MQNQFDTLNAENAMHAYAKQDSRETTDGKPFDAREAWQAMRRTIRLQTLRENRPFAKRARKSAKIANRNAWKLLRAIHAEIAPKIRALRGLEYLEA